MACSSKTLFHVPKLNESMLLDSKSKEVFSICPSKHGKAKPSINSSTVSINVCKTLLFSILEFLISYDVFFLTLILCFYFSRHMQQFVLAKV